MVGAILLAGAVAWRVASGPVSLAFLTPSLEDALSSEAARVTLNDATLALDGWRDGVRVGANRVRVTGAGGAELGTLSELTVSLSLPDVLRGIVAPSRIDIRQPQLQLVRREDGSLGLGGDGDDAAVALIEALLGDLDEETAGTHTLDRLERIGIIDADLRFDDLRVGTSWHAPRADIVLTRKADAIAAAVDLDLDIDGVETPVRATGRYHPLSGLAEINATFEPVMPARLAALVPTLSVAAGIEVPVAGQVAIVADRSGHMFQLGFDLTAGAGTVTLPELYLDQVAIAGGRAIGAIVNDLSRVELNSLVIDFGGPMLNASAVAEGDPAAPDLIVDLTVAQLPVEHLVALWPQPVAPGGRGWIANNISAGMVRSVSLRVQMGAADWAGERLPDRAIDGEIELDAVDLCYLSGLPEVTAIDASGRFSAHRLDLMIHRGASAGLAVEGTLALADLGSRVERAEIALEVRGAVAEVLALLDRPRLDLVAGLGIDPARASGSSTSQLSVRLPLVAGLAWQDVDISARSQLVGAGLEFNVHPFALAALSDGHIDLTVDHDGMNLRGDAALNGTPVTLTWRENFAADREFLRRLEVAGRFDDDARRQFAADLPGLSGPLDLRLSYAEGDDGRSHTQVAVGADDAAVDLPQLGWHKPAGAAARGSLELRTAPGRPTEVTSFSVDAEELAASGRATVGEHGGVAALDIDWMRFGGGEISGWMRIADDGAVEIALAGADLDLRPYLDRAEDEGHALLEGLIRLSLDLRRVTIADDRSLDSLAGQANLQGGIMRSADLALLVAGGGEARLTITPSGERRQLLLSAGDAGAVARGLDIADGMVGGRLTASAEIRDDQPDRPIVGTLLIDDFRVVDAPLLARLLNVASLTGAVEMLDGRGLAFSRLTMPFAYHDGIVSVTSGKVAGLSLGFTFEGRLDLDGPATSLRGTIVPAYALNTALGQVPVLGGVFTGRGDGDGVFAATYRLTGPLDEPEILVNPLTALAPGILRELFIALGAAGQGQRDEP